MSWDAELDALRDRARAERDAGAPMFIGRPDRWYEAGLRRCENGHVSTRTLSSEALGRDACLAAGCMGRVALTFPEDVETNPPTRLTTM